MPPPNLDFRPPAAGRAFRRAQADRAPLARAEVVRTLGFTDAAAGQPVALSGVVTYLRDLEGRVFNFNLNDGTGGVMVYPNATLSVEPAAEAASEAWRRGLLALG